MEQTTPHGITPGVEICLIARRIHGGAPVPGNTPEVSGRHRGKDNECLLESWSKPCL